ncbi:hypothetical protein D9V32_03990 [Mycetocola tolaasinivorans]|uniref:Uncharacterized protein n=1 Tax=Mycetocola tolaasinivorans TaxID=76635 RepID=A0A3L7AAF6_9MICO|nr:hypothetical protein D9V32_03990 [Mycetocola tolaasinivorans]
MVVPAERAGDHEIERLMRSLAQPLLLAGFSLVTGVVRDVAHETELYRLWARPESMIEGVALLDAVADDPRIVLLNTLGLPHAGIIRGDFAVGYPAVMAVTADAETSAHRGRETGGLLGEQVLAAVRGDAARTLSVEADHDQRSTS